MNGSLHWGRMTVADFSWQTLRNFPAQYFLFGERTITFSRPGMWCRFYVGFWPKPWRRNLPCARQTNPPTTRSALPPPSPLRNVAWWPKWQKESGMPKPASRPARSTSIDVQIIGVQGQLYKREMRHAAKGKHSTAHQHA